MIIVESSNICFNFTDSEQGVKIKEARSFCIKFAKFLLLKNDLAFEVYAFHQVGEIEF